MPAPLIVSNRNFGKAWLGQVVSQSGTRMYQIGIVWWLVSSTARDAGKTAAVFLVLAAAPSVLLAGPIGRLIDSHRTKTILWVADGLNFLVAGAATFALYRDPHLPIFWIYLAGFLIASLQAVTDPAFSKAIPELVETDKLGAATAYQTSTLSLGFFLGSSLGALLIPVLGVPGVVAANALSYAISACLIFSARFRTEGSARAPAEERTNLSPWRMLERYPRVKRLLFGMALTNFCTVPTFIILPLYVSRVLHGDASTLASIESGIWLGILAGAVLSRKLRLTESPESLGAICCAVLAIGLAAPGLVIGARFFFLMACLQGVAFSFLPIRFIALFQEEIAPEMKGRFFALMSALLGATLPLSQWVAGALADWMPVTSLCLLQGIGAALVSAGFLFPWDAEPLARRTARG